MVRVVREAFLATHNGWSTDEVLLQDRLNVRFLKRCRQSLPCAEAFDCNWTLLNLRKAGSLGSVVTRRRRDAHDDYLHAAEIAARLMHDQHRLTMDRVVCDPVRRAEFDRIALSIARGPAQAKTDPFILSPDPGANVTAKPPEPVDLAYRLRKAALRLRKSRQLRPELVLRVADWGRQILVHDAEQILKDPRLVPPQPGVYIFRDRSGYLYIGESRDLRARVMKHLDRSDRVSLAAYLWDRGIRGITVELHAFDPESRANRKTIRRAYESELIRSRRPRFNVRP